MINVLQIGPSVSMAKGGMSDVIKNIVDNMDEYQVDSYASYKDGNRIAKVLFSFFAFIKIKKLINNYDLFHIHVASSTSFFRKSLYINYLFRKKKRIVLHIHGGNFISFYNKQPTLIKRYICKVLNKSCTIITLSQHIKDFCSQVLNVKNVVCLYNAIKISNYHYRNDNNRFRNSFAFIGRIEVLKGIYEMIDAIGLLAKKGLNPKVFIAGVGSEFEKAKEYVREKSLDSYIVFLGWINLEKKNELYSKVGSILLPSYYEALPVTIIEAMCCGKNIICTEVGALNEFLFEGENCSYIRIKDVFSIYEVMEKTMTTNSDLNAIGLNNRIKSKTLFDINLWIIKLKEIYGQVIKNGCYFQ